MFCLSAELEKTKAVLYRCAELDKLELIQKVVRFMTDNLAYVPMLLTQQRICFIRVKIHLPQLCTNQ